MQDACANIIKIGGSVIANDARREAFRSDVVRRIAKNIPTESILIHGSGAYGKPAAIKHGYLDGVVSRALTGDILYVRQQLATLNSLFVDSLISGGRPAFGISASVVFSQRGKRVCFTGKKIVEDCLARNIVPVIHSDFIFYRDDCLRVISSDKIVYLLTSIYRPVNTVFATNVDGVYESGNISATEGKIYQDISLKTFKQDRKGIQRDPLDVTGSMYEKVAYALRAARYSRNCVIVNGYKSERIRAFCAGKRVTGTRVLHCGSQS